MGVIDSCTTHVQTHGVVDVLASLGLFCKQERVPGFRDDPNQGCSETGFFDEERGGQ